MDGAKGRGDMRRGGFEVESNFEQKGKAKRTVETTETDLRRLAALKDREPLFMLLNVSEDDENDDGIDEESVDKKHYRVRFSLVDAQMLRQDALDEDTLCFELRRVREDGAPAPRADAEQAAPQRRVIDTPNDERVNALILRAGIPPHIQGYRYLCDAVNMVIQTPGLINRITKELYPSIAARYDDSVSGSKVERSIRHAITVLWSRGQLDRINGLFGYEVCRIESKPTNGEFIALLAGVCGEDR